jgi:hypothetical protein
MHFWLCKIAEVVCGVLADLLLLCFARWIDHLFSVFRHRLWRTTMKSLLYHISKLLSPP